MKCARMASSPNKMKDKLSLRKRIFIKKSTKVGCYVDSGSLSDDSNVSSSSRPVSPANPFLAHNCNSHGDRTNNTTNRIQRDVRSSVTRHMNTYNSSSVFKKCRPHSLVEGQKLNSDRQKSNLKSSLSEQSLTTVSGSRDNIPLYSRSVKSRPLDIQIASLKKLNKKHSSLENQPLSSTPAKSNSFNKRLSVDNLDCVKNGKLYQCNSSPESDTRDTRSCSLEGRYRSKSQSVVRPNSQTGSADSLARNSLLAAQVLRLIPTSEARERNFLHGRLASNSLLGATELDHVFPDRQVTLFVGTWNMNGQRPPRELNDFIFPSGIEHVPDIFVIGTQESFSERMEWEVSIQEVLGPSHLLLHSATLGTLHLTIFVRRDLIWFCSLPEEASMSVRPGVAFRTKGAVAVAFALFGSTFLFVTAHLTAHQEKVKERVQDVKRIVKSMDLPKHLPCRQRSKDVTNNFDYVIWSGDLNFRLGEPRAAVLRWIAETEFPLPDHLPHGVLHTDQLTSILGKGTAFRDFKEAPITFPPTYKYDPGTQQFDTSSKQRAPAYTDRILYKTRPVRRLSGSSVLLGLRRISGTNSPSASAESNALAAESLRCVAYDSAQTICSSDHKPVWALFTAVLRPGTDNIPLAAGLFNRDVYLEGIKRRAATIEYDPGTSAICSIQ